MGYLWKNETDIIDISVVYRTLVRCMAYASVMHTIKAHYKISCCIIWTNKLNQQAKRIKDIGFITWITTSIPNYKRNCLCMRNFKSYAISFLQYTHSSTVIRIAKILQYILHAVVAVSLSCYALHRNPNFLWKCHTSLQWKCMKSCQYSILIPQNYCYPSDFTLALKFVK